VNQFDVIYAKFAPRRLDDLTPEAKTALGVVGEWKALWVIESGQFSGEWAMDLRGSVGLGWIPSGDLEPVVRGGGE